MKTNPNRSQFQPPNHEDNPMTYSTRHTPICGDVSQSNVGATLAVALNAHTHKHGANTTAHGATTHAQGDREGRPYSGWALGLVLCFFLVLGCSNPYERDNPTDPAIVHKITFNANGATGGTAPAAISGSYGDVVTLPGQDSLVKDGYILVSWTDLDGKNYSASSSYTIKGSADMNANWLPAYTISFDGNGTTSGTYLVPSDTMVASGSSIQIPAGRYDFSPMERTGYVFGGWNTNSSGTGTNYAVGSYYYPTGNITLYANWTPAYTLTFDANGATSGTAPAAMTIAPGGSSIKIPSMYYGLQRTGYYFDGWYSNSSGTGTKYDIGSSYTFTGNTTLYAKWVLFICSSNEDSGTFTDARDGKTYGYVTICNQTWMSKNLNYNADGSKCYDNLDSNCDTYGRMYSRQAAIAVCPEGWHLPSLAEWELLGAYVGNNVNKLKATTGWKSETKTCTSEEENRSWDCSYNYNGTDDYGFSALPGGEGGYSNAPFTRIGDQAYWWTATVIDGYHYYVEGLTTKTESTFYASTIKSVRCIKDN
jgi:uncharacterized protein (TIGR02145 family)/uncharacterized repeat protein (TIGR02543 family)